MGILKKESFKNKKPYNITYVYKWNVLIEE